MSDRTEIVEPPLGRGVANNAGVLGPGEDGSDAGIVERG